MSEHNKDLASSDSRKKPSAVKVPDGVVKKPAKEFGGRKDGLDPTRYGDWEKNGRCIDF